MTTPLAPGPAGSDCWNKIGISGDRSCPELIEYVHCRNCPVFASAASGLFDREAPGGYIEEWTRRLDAPTVAPPRDSLGVLIFRLADEWLAVRTRVVVEVTKPRPVHRIPHRSDGTLVGLVNLRGQLQLQVSLRSLFGIDKSTDGHSSGEEAEKARRLVVLRRTGTTWVFKADEVGEVRPVSSSALIAVPSTLANAASSFSHAVIAWRGKNVGLLDEQRVFDALKGLER